MTLDEPWEAGLRAELTSLAARSHARLALSDPWHRALTCCLTAQTIRWRRTRNTPLKPAVNHPAQTMNWEKAFNDARQRAWAKAVRQQEKGSWEYSLKVKLTGWHTRLQLVTNGQSFEPPT